MNQSACSVTTALSSVSFTSVGIQRHDFCICVRGSTYSHSQKFLLAAAKDKGGYCMGTSQIFGSEFMGSTKNFIKS